MQEIGHSGITRQQTCYADIWWRLSHFLATPLSQGTNCAQLKCSFIISRGSLALEESLSNNVRIDSSFQSTPLKRKSAFLLTGQNTTGNNILICFPSLEEYKMITRNDSQSSSGQQIIMYGMFSHKIEKHKTNSKECRGFYLHNTQLIMSWVQCKAWDGRLLVQMPWAESCLFRILIWPILQLYSYIYSYKHLTDLQTNNRISCFTEHQLLTDKSFIACDSIQFRQYNAPLLFHWTST